MNLPAEALDLLNERLSDHQLILARKQDPPPVGCSIVFGQPDPELLMTSSALQWVHVASAGYTAFDRDDFREFVRRRGVAVTNSSSVYEEPCAQHAVAMMLSMARRMPECLENQRCDRGWPHRVLRDASFLLHGGQTVLLLGFGRIAARVVELLRPFGLRLIGVRRRPSGDEGIPVLRCEEVDRLLPEADHILNILPESPSTLHFFNADRFERCKSGAYFYNIGRGATVDQQALLRALEGGRLAAACLDVTDPEPLPSDHPLWSAPNCYITPHTAGGHAGEMMRLVQHFVGNLERFTSGEPLRDAILRV